MLNSVGKKKKKRRASRYESGEINGPIRTLAFIRGGYLRTSAEFFQIRDNLQLDYSIVRSEKGEWRRKRNREKEERVDKKLVGRKSESE